MASLKPTIKMIKRLFRKNLVIDDSVMLRITRVIDAKKRLTPPVSVKEPTEATNHKLHT